MYKVGIVVPFYGGNAYIWKLVASLAEAGAGFEVFVFVIDNSRPAERLNVDLSAFANVNVIAAEEGIGYGRACNIGYRLCLERKLDIILVVNQDGYFADGGLRKLLEPLVEHEDFTISVPLLTLYDSDEVESFFTHVYLTPMTELVSDLFRGSVKPFYRIEQLCGACFAMKLKDYFGFDYLFDKLYFMYYEDADLFERLSAMGRKVMIVPGSVFHHKHTHTDEQAHGIYSLAQIRTSSHIFYLKNRSATSLRALLNWLVVEFRNFIEFVLKFQWRNLLVEMLSFTRAIVKLPRIFRARMKRNIAGGRKV